MRRFHRRYIIFVIAVVGWISLSVAVMMMIAQGASTVHWVLSVFIIVLGFLGIAQQYRAVSQRDDTNRTS